MRQKCNGYFGNKHSWAYEHTVFAGPRGGIKVVRLCHKCGLEQVGELTRWRPPLENEFSPTIKEILNVRYNQNAKKASPCTTSLKGYWGWGIFPNREKK